MNRRDLIKLSAVSLPLSAQTTAAWKPMLFDDHQNETVIALTELIIPATDTPGAKAALVNRHLDKALHDGPAEQQERFLSGLAALDGRAIRAHGHPFVRCTPEQQTALLEALEAARDPFFLMAKGRTSSIYYATEVGFKELNKGGRVPPTIQACAHKEHA